MRKVVKKPVTEKDVFKLMLENAEKKAKKEEMKK